MNRRLLPTIAALLAITPLAPAAAQEFSALVSPPRFELTSRGGTLHQIFELTNRSSAPAKYHVRTADFTLGADYSVSFQDALQADSCRPWVALERGTVALPAGGTIRYRFEVQVPKDAPPGECRFAMLIEGDDASLAKAGSVQLPVVGRLGIIVYVVIGDAAPKIEFFGPTEVNLNGRQLPALRLHNDGNAHTRMGGFLSGSDAKGQKFDFTPSDFPILPGETRDVFLTPSRAGEDAQPPLTFPVSVHGRLEWADQSTEINEQFK